MGQGSCHALTVIPQAGQSLCPCPSLHKLCNSLRALNRVCRPHHSKYATTVTLRSCWPYNNHRHYTYLGISKILHCNQHTRSMIKILFINAYIFTMMSLVIGTKQTYNLYIEAQQEYKSLCSILTILLLSHSAYHYFIFIECSLLICGIHQFNPILKPQHPAPFVLV